MAELQETMAATPNDARPGALYNPELPIKGKSRQRLLRGIQRISSSPSLSGLRRSKSVGSPYKTRSTLSCASLAAVGPATPSSATPTPPQPSPLGLPTSSTLANAPTSISEFPFYKDVEEYAAIRKISRSALAAGPNIASLPADSGLRPDGLTRARAASRTLQKAPHQLWNALPSEIQLSVLAHLKPKELVRASRVSRSFYRFCFDGQLWTYFDASSFYQEIPAEAIAKIATAAGPFIRHLNLRGCVQVEHYRRAEVIVKACQNLVDASLEGCRNVHKSSLQTLLRNNTQLVRLELTGLAAVTTSSCKTIAESCPQLEKLNISWCEKVDAKGIRAIVEGCPKLNDLRAGEVRGFDSISLANAIFKTNNLERLVLSGCAELSDAALKTMMQGTEPEIDILSNIAMVPPRKLRHLDLSRCPRLSDDGVSSMGHLTPHLEGLQLSGCKSLSDDALECVLATTPQLTHLELEELDGLTNALFAEHLANAPCANTLKYLSLSYCENVGDVGVLPVMQKCTSLKTVELDNTRISDLVLAEAAYMVHRRSTRSMSADVRPKATLRLTVYDCQNVTWTGIREVLYRNTEIKAAPGQLGKVDYPTESIGLKCFYGFQMTVNEHQKRVSRGDFVGAGRLERKWADYMQATEEAGASGSGYRRRRRRAREAQALHLDEEDPAFPGRRRARTMGSCAVM